MPAQGLAEPEWADLLTDADRRGLTPLFWSNINPLRHCLPRHGPPARARTPAYSRRASRRRIAPTLRLGTATEGGGQSARPTTSSVMRRPAGRPRFDDAPCLRHTAS
jgi:hypothetical protein